LVHLEFCGSIYCIFLRRQSVTSKRKERAIAQVSAVLGVALSVFLFVFLVGGANECDLVVTVSPAGATVQLMAPDRVARRFTSQKAMAGETVFSRLPAGVYVELEAVAVGFDVATRRVFLPREGGKVHLAMNLASETALVTVRTEPPKANIYLDGKSVGTSPMLLSQVPPGKHVVTARKADFEERSETFTVQSGDSKSIELVLSFSGKATLEDAGLASDQSPEESLPPGFGRVTLVSSHSASFFIDNKSVGMGTRIMRNVPAGSHLVLCRATKRGQKSRRVEVIEKTNHVIRFDFPEDPVDKAHRATDPSQALYWVIKGGTTRNSGRYGDSVEMFRTALQIEPNNASAHRQLAFTLPSMKALGPERWDDAMEHMERYLELDPNAPDKEFAEEMILLYQQKKEEER
jgi:hypothetical protein